MRMIAYLSWSVLILAFHGVFFVFVVDDLEYRQLTVDPANYECS